MVSIVSDELAKGLIMSANLTRRYTDSLVLHAPAPIYYIV
jgi:hypothetical protein